MKTNTGLYRLTEEINVHLSNMPGDKRPLASTRARIQSVAYAARGFFETTDSDGHTEDVTVETAKAWLKL